MNYDMKTKYKGCFKMINVVLRYRYTYVFRAYGYSCFVLGHSCLVENKTIWYTESDVFIL